mgnify:CR=1 FL=1
MRKRHSNLAGGYGVCVVDGWLEGFHTHHHPSRGDLNLVGCLASKKLQFALINLSRRKLLTNVLPPADGKKWGTTISTSLIHYLRIIKWLPKKKSEHATFFSFFFLTDSKPCMLFTWTLYSSFFLSLTWSISSLRSVCFYLSCLSGEGNGAVLV